MLKTLLASGATAAVLAFGIGPSAVMAQPAPETDQMAPAPIAPADDAAPTGGAMAPESTPPDSLAADPAAGEDVGEAAIATELAPIPRDELIGSDIKAAADQETVASVEDVILDADGRVKNVVARFGGFLGFGETTVLLMPDEVTPYRTDDGTVELTTTLTPDALKDRPEYTPPSN